MPSFLRRLSRRQKFSTVAGSSSGTGKKETFFYTHNFPNELVEDWKYRGLRIAYDFRKDSTRKHIRNAVFSGLRHLLRGMFFVHVKKLGKNRIVINITEFLAQKKTTVLFSDKLIAQIEVTKTSSGSFFVFHILDKEMAKSRNLSVESLHAVSKHVFDTALIRCSGRDGDLELTGDMKLNDEKKDWPEDTYDVTAMLLH